MNVALVGPTCSGKTTCARRLCEPFHLRHLSTGQVLRENREQQTALGILTRAYMERGELVPDEIISAMIEEAVRKTPIEQGILFDGFPSTLYQARFLDELFRATRRQLDAVVFLNIPEPAVFDRASKRVPRRTDDRQEILRNRLQVFRRTTGPVIDFYRNGKRLYYLDASGTVESVSAAVSDVLTKACAGPFQTALTESENRLVDELLIRPAPIKVSSTMPSLDIVVMGAPGSGKGTQAAYLAEQLRLPHIATGELFRENLEQDTILGKIAHAYIERGELVPDDVTEAMVRDRLNRRDASEGFILDGFPRTLPQAQALDEIMANMNRKLDCVINLDVPDDVIIGRISGRRLCPVCQTPYHVDFNKPLKENACDRDGSPLYQRPDDNSETVRARLKAFHAQTMPVIIYYRQTGLTVDVPGSGEVSQVRQSMLAVVQQIKRQ